jgi:hypothetical protein
MPRYLALDEILPGDTILSAALTLRSIAIRLLTGSTTASHAAMAIHPLIWFESIGKGVNYKIISPKLVWDGRRVCLAMESPKRQRYAVRRVRGLCESRDQKDRNATAKLLIAASSRFVFLNYASPDSFLATLRLGLDKNTFVHFVANNFSKNASKFFPGPFCSWLVAELYGDIGQAIFDKDPRKITPAALARSKRLELVDLIFEGEPVDLAPRFGNFESDLNQDVEMSAATLGGALSNAAFAMGATELNDRLKGFLQIGWNLAGKEFPAEQERKFRDTEARYKAHFEWAQAHAIRALENVYPSLTIQADQIDSINQCYAKCLKPWFDGIPCGEQSRDSCHLASEAYHKSYEEVFKDFPEPEIGDPPFASHEADRPGSVPPVDN